jgi:hypothetical protein
VRYASDCSSRFQGLRDQERPGPAEPPRSPETLGTTGTVKKLLHALPADAVGYGRPNGLRANPGRGRSESKRTAVPSGYAETGRGAALEGSRHEAQHNRLTDRFWTGETTRVGRHLIRTARLQAARHAGVTVSDVKCGDQGGSFVPGGLRTDRNLAGDTGWFQPGKEGPLALVRREENQESESGVAAGAVERRRPRPTPRPATQPSRARIGPASGVVHNDSMSLAKPASHGLHQWVGWLRHRRETETFRCPTRHGCSSEGSGNPARSDAARKRRWTNIVPIGWLTLI